MALRWLAWTAVWSGLAAAGTVPGLAQNPVYRDPAQPVDIRVADLLGRMTLDEKVAQLLGVWQQRTAIQRPDGSFNPDGAKALIGDGIGQIARPSEIAGPDRKTRSPREHAQFVNDAQKWLIANTRLGIPAMFHDEALHGLTAPRGTHFPVPIGLGSTWDPALVERVMAIAAREARARAASTCCRQWWISAATRAGAASRKPTARIRTTSRAWAWPPSAAIRDDRCRSRRTRCLPR